MIWNGDLTSIVAVAGGTAALLYYVFRGSSKYDDRRTLRGMRNLGRTCFANALLQSLASCSSFVEWFGKMSDEEPSSSLNSTNLVLLRELNELISALNNVDDGEVDISANGIIRALRAHDWIVRTNVEQDLYELLNIFIEIWEEEIASFVRANEKISSLIDLKELNEDDTTDLRGPNFLKSLSALKEIQSYRRMPCSGLLATQFHCGNCGHKTLTLEHCIRKYFAVEKLYNVTCESCHVKSGDPATGRSQFFKRQGLSKLPNCLVIRIERMAWLPSGVCFKHNDIVQFLEFLDIRDFVFYRSKEQDYNAGVVGGASAPVQPSARLATPSIKDPFCHLRELALANYGLQQGATISRAPTTTTINVESAKDMLNLRYKYRLKAVAEHLGDATSGHFVTYRRGPSHDANSWYYTSDSFVEKVDFDTEISSCQAYMLFYERVSRTGNVA